MSEPMRWRCKRCGEEGATIHDLECGMPHFVAIVPYEDRPRTDGRACPLEEINYDT